MCNFSMATTEKWKNKDGEKQESTEWHALVAFGKLAEICGEYLQKGSKIYAEGKSVTRKWEDKNSGDMRYKGEMVISEIKFLDKIKGNDQRSSGGQPAGGGYSPPAPGDDDIPF